ncbi:MAG: 2-amino-4-hydroxy-6-hydroxymethyldihydropteridine diphosphokinase [Acidiferrobacterales bacterium]
MNNSDRSARAYIGLGSNLDDPVAHVRAGIDALGALPHTLSERCSSLYRTAPLGPVAQPDFINAVCRVVTALAPDTLMYALLEIERQRGRVRQGGRWGPRTLDLDLLLYGQRQLCTDDLVVPHPRLHERAFVLYPLMELDPDLVIPGRGRVSELLRGCAQQRVLKLED